MQKKPAANKHVRPWRTTGASPSHGRVPVVAVRRFAAPSDCRHGNRRLHDGGATPGFRGPVRLAMSGVGPTAMAEG